MTTTTTHTITLDELTERIARQDEVIDALRTAEQSHEANELSRRKTKFTLHLLFVLPGLAITVIVTHGLDYITGAAFGPSIFIEVVDFVRKI